MLHHRQGGGPEGAVVGMTRMLALFKKLLLSHCGGGTARGTSLLSQGRRSGPGCIVTTSLHKGDLGHVLVASVILLPCWDRVW